MLEILAFILCTTLLLLSTHNLTAIHKMANNTSTDGIVIMSRSAWGARDPKEIQELVHPVPKVIIHHSLMGGNNATSVQEETELIKNIQDFHMDSESRKWSDIGYSFLVGQSGTVFEGRGWNRVGAHSLGNNAVSIGICLLGDFTDKLPTDQQLKATQDLIGEGVRIGVISEEYVLFGHRDVRNGTECPGTAFYTQILSSWPRKGVAKPEEIF